MAKTDGFCNRAEAYEAHDNVPLSPGQGDTIGDLILRRYSRRAVLRGTLGAAAGAALFGPSLLAGAAARAEDAPDRFAFTEIAAGVDGTHHVAEGYRADVLLRWGDPLFPDAPPFDPLRQSADAQLKQFGYNNDYIAFFPLDDTGRRGLLCVNHEYTNEEIMFPGLAHQDPICFPDMTAELVAIEMAAHGVSVVEIARGDDGWRPVLDSRYNRRISPANTPMSVDGPAAGHARLRTSADPSGGNILGTLNNCAGGVTPWGTYLTAEENFHGYFWSNLCAEGGKVPKVSAGRRRRATSATAYRACGRPGASSSTASTWTRSRTNRTASAGSSRSTRSIRRRCR
jgi:secreted PhoX family phosphatase